ncbi:GfV-C7-ORF1 [Operophtera brumata]|uniref:GfV-C7-ORF1 n=1 Tax=Operophtera brumata TaxID=104452 RepID=A0A0L7LBP8_OPEBR|nr:GfV-C7-ORF1 [Operophtera brumata]
MMTDSFTKMIAERNSKSGNYFHEVCHAGNLQLLHRAESFLQPAHQHLLREFDYDGLQPIHVTAEYQAGGWAAHIIDQLIMMGAYINGQERRGGDTALHMTIYQVSVRTLKRIKNEGVVNEGVWSTTGKKRPHQSTVSNLDSFDMDVIRNKLNEFYIVRKQVPTLRTLLAELKESIGFSGSHETLRQILLKSGYEFKKNKNEQPKYKERDRITEDNLERFIINVGENSSNDTSDSDVSLQVEFLDSDFDYDE